MWKRLLLVVVSVTLTLAAVEVGLRVLDVPVPPGLGEWLGEATYFHRGNFYGGTADFDPEVGWRHRPSYTREGVTERINPQRFRSPLDFDQPKRRPRVIIIGDSFTYGQDQPDHLAIPELVQGELGNEFDVLNMGMQAWGVDQMGVAATRIAPRYQPDILVIAFIAHDLVRSCWTFAWGQALRPVYKLEGDRLIQPELPLPSLEEQRKRHYARRHLNAVLATLAQSRTLAILFDPIYHRREQHCVAKLNPAILQDVKRKLEPRTKVLFAHLWADLPPGFEEEMQRRGLKIVDVYHRADELAAAFGLKMGFIPGTHPDETRSRVYAMALAEAIYETKKGRARSPSPERILGSVDRD